MNKQFKALVEQTGYILESDKTKTGMPVEDEFVEKFAKLLLKDVGQFLTDIGHDYAREQLEKRYNMVDPRFTEHLRKLYNQ